MHLMVAPEDTDLMHGHQSSKEHITPQGNLVRHIEVAVYGLRHTWEPPVVHAGMLQS